MYDIVNILESVEVMSRLGKNQYQWNGFDMLATALDRLRREAIGEGTAGERRRAETRKEKSLGLLSRRFVQMFFKSHSRIVTLDQAGNALVEKKPTPAGQQPKKSFKSKVRRLYDIANVLTSLNLIQKIYMVDTRKPAFMWLGAGVFPLQSNVEHDSFVISSKEAPAPPRATKRRGAAAGDSRGGKRSRGARQKMSVLGLTSARAKATPLPPAPPARPAQRVLFQIAPKTAGLSPLPVSFKVLQGGALDAFVRQYENAANFAKSSSYVKEMERLRAGAVS